MSLANIEIRLQYRFLLHFRTHTTRALCIVGFVSFNFQNEQSTKKKKNLYYFLIMENHVRFYDDCTERKFSFNIDHSNMFGIRELCTIMAPMP